MKIGILTYLRIINKGSVMQAYCLQQLLNEAVPKAEIEFIDYRPFSVEKNEFLKPVRMSASQLLDKQLPTAIYSQWGKIRSIRSFVDEYCVVSNEKSYTEHTAQAQEYIEEQEYDVVIVGSDTVWCTRNAGYEPLQPNIYVLPNIDDVTKVGFAASADGTDETLLYQNKRDEQMAEYITDFDYISVRDEYTSNLLEDIGVPQSKINKLIDPTLLWDFENIIRDPELPNSDRLVAIEIGDFEIKQTISKYLKEKGYDVLNLLGPSVSWEHSLSPSAAVCERLGVYRNVDYVITDRFHGSIFTLKTSETPIVYVEPTSKYPNSNSKGRDLYRTLEIEDQILRCDSNDPSTDLSSISKKWDSMEAVDTGIESLRENYQGVISEITSIIAE